MLSQAEFLIVVLLTIYFFLYKCRDDNSESLKVCLFSYNPEPGICKYAVSAPSALMTKILNQDPTAIKENLRVSVQVFRKVISLMPHKRSGWDREIELSVFLYWIAAGTSYRVAGVSFDIPRATVKRICHKMLAFVLDVLMMQVIKYPNADELVEIARGFCSRANSGIFERAVGAIDGSHVKIKCPPSLHDQYINRKLDYSIQCQAVCDSKHKFLDICVGYPGSVHDTRVMYNSPLYYRRLYPPPGYYLLGDSGYPCSIHPIAIITPFKETGRQRLTPMQRKFNNLHSKARNIVECAFGQMKNRWRSIFYKTLELRIDNCVRVIVACCVLHNICIDENDIMEAESIIEDHEELEGNAAAFQEGEFQPVRDTGEGIAFRLQLLQQIMGPRMED
ncbi:uncharacterized protein LOC115254698 [Aedes albopictus]|uniref:DDE Tnp4 domain-containing protein n=1 Tax=Aedes albopictus TaxID=7160 RepID=A0ABM1ZEB5_AEDAL|nr:protein ALP1-like [Aedes albopictus]